MEEDFFDWFETVNAEALEDGTLDGFLEEMERMNPLSDNFDPRKSLADFRGKYEASFNSHGKKRQGRPSLKTFFGVAAVIAALSSVVTAQAAGVDVLGIFASWTRDIFPFATSKNMKFGLSCRV